MHWHYSGTREGYDGKNGLKGTQYQHTEKPHASSIVEDLDWVDQEQNQQHSYAQGDGHWGYVCEAAVQVAQHTHCPQHAQKWGHL